MEQAPICSWQSTISSEKYFRRQIKVGLSLHRQTICTSLRNHQGPLCRSRVLQDGLGKNVLLSGITTSDLTTYAARRRAALSNRSVNISSSSTSEQ
jgi:hypothetical protein